MINCIISAQKNIYCHNANGLRPLIVLVEFSLANMFDHVSHSTRNLSSLPHRLPYV